MNHLPATIEEVRTRGWDAPDIILVSGDAYVDHPSFGVAVIGRVLEKAGYRVAILAQPDWRNPESITVLGKPRYFFGVTAGNVDSMLAHYTAFGKVRNDDPYSPGGKAGLRPNRATIVYCNLIRAAFKGVPIIIGGIEASMRRLAHYDFWDNAVRRSIILDSRADLLVYGMGENAITEAASSISRGQSPNQITGTVEISQTIPDDVIRLPAEEEVLGDKTSFLEMYRLLYQHPGERLAQPSGGRYIIHNPPANQTQKELDDIYSLPFTREPHPFYIERSIPAFEMIRSSITSHRGCVSGCSFCSLALHQGRKIVSRSVESIYDEAGKIQRMKYFGGHITDIGGPSANMYGYRCRAGWRCNRESCLHPDVCVNLVADESLWLALLSGASKLPGIKHVTVGSGVRYDVLLRNGGQSLLNELVKNHVSGQLKIAPEHTSERVLRAMRKAPGVELREFADSFTRASRLAGRKLYLIPYLMSCHPGCTIDDMRKMRDKVLSLFRFVPDQVQAFIPLPMTISSVMYWTGTDPLTGEKFFSECDASRRRKQHSIFYSKWKY